MSLPVVGTQQAPAHGKVEVNSRPWELPLAILLWMNVGGVVVFAIWLLSTLGNSEPSLYNY